MINFLTAVHRHNTAAIWVLIGLLTGAVAPDRISDVMGRINPAAAPMVLIEPVVKVSDGVEFSGESERLRPGCNPVRLEWFLGQRGGRYVPVSSDWGPAEVRPDGAFTFNKWTVEISDPDTFRSGSFSDVIHQCYVFYDVVDGKAVGGIRLPWETRTQFWN